MKPVTQLTVCLVCAIGGLFLGESLGRHGSKKTTDATRPDSARPQTEAPGQGDAAGKKPEDNNRLSRMARLMDGSARGGQPSLAAAWRETAGDPGMREWLAELWMRQDPAALIRMLAKERESGGDQIPDLFIERLVPRFAYADPEGALEMGEGLKPPLIGRWMTSQAIVAIMETDKQKGLELAAAHPELRISANMDLDKIDVTPADIPLLLSLANSGSVQDLLSKAMNGLPVAEALRLTSGMSATPRILMHRKLAKRWADEDADAAFEYATTQATYGQRLSILEQIGKQKLEGDPAEAAAWAEQNLSGNARNRVVDSAADDLEISDPEAAAALRERLPQNYNPKGK